MMFVDNDRIIFTLRALNRRWFNPSLLRRRYFDGHIVSMHQSGSHWLKNMLAHVLMEVYGLPPMKHIQDDSIVGHTKSPPIYKHIPRLVHSHTLPHALTLRLPFVHFPKYLVLVRDIKHSLISHFERFKQRYNNISFTEYLHGDISGKRFFTDIYSRIIFMNEWGRVLATGSDKISFIRYEDMSKMPQESLEKALKFFNIENYTSGFIENAVNACNRENMSRKPNPDVDTTVVRVNTGKNPDDYFNPENEDFFRATCKNYLEYDFGYQLIN